MRTAKIVATFMALVLAAGFGSAFAQTDQEPAAQAPAQAAPAAPAAKMEKNQIPYISGGVGEEEMTELKRVQSDYNLKLLFTATKGEFLASVPVTIEDMKGNRVLETTAQGPVLLAKLPAGKYKVMAHYKEQCVTHKLSAPAKGLHTVQFRMGVE